MKWWYLYIVYIFINSRIIYKDIIIWLYYPFFISICVIFHKNICKTNLDIYLFYLSKNVRIHDFKLLRKERKVSFWFYTAPVSRTKVLSSYAHMHSIRGTNTRYSLSSRLLSSRPMTFRKIASVRNGSEVICEVKAELRDDGTRAGKLRDVVALGQVRERERKRDRRI